MKGVISTDGASLTELKTLNYGVVWLVKLGKEVCGDEIEVVHEPTNPVATVNVIDAGCKQNIVRLLSGIDCRVRVAPITSGNRNGAKTATLYS